MPTEYEHFVMLWRGNGNVLGTCLWVDVAAELFLVPSTVVYIVIKYVKWVLLLPIFIRKRSLLGRILLPFFELSIPPKPHKYYSYEILTVRRK